MISTLPLTFVTIVEKGSITKAAEELNLAKSAVSQNLKRLEEQLGLKLMKRTTRRLSLTPAGERYYMRCKEMLALSKIASTEMEDFGATPSGPITITAPHAMISPVIAPAISKVMKEYPELKPSIIADDKRLDLIARGIDVSITVGKLKDSSLRARKVGELSDVLCVSPNLLEKVCDVNSADAICAIQSLPYIAHQREDYPGVYTLNSLTGEKPLRLKFEQTLLCNTVEALIAFAREGLGVALIPDLAILNDINNKHLIQLFPDYTLQEKDINAVHAYDVPPKSVVKVMDAVQAELRQ